MSIYPINETEAIVGYWSRGVFRVKSEGGKEFTKRLLLNHGMTDIIQDAYSRYIFTRPDNYQVYTTNNFKIVNKIAKFQNMSDSKARHLKISPSGVFFALRESNQVISIFESKKDEVVLVKRINTDPFNGKISDFCFNEKDEILVLTPQGIVYWDSKEKGGIEKLNLAEEKEKKYQHYAIDYCLFSQTIFIAKNEYLLLEKLYKGIISAYKIKKSQKIKKITDLEFPDFKSKKSNLINNL